MVDLQKVKSLAEWLVARSEIEKTIHEVLGRMPKEIVDLQVKTMDEFSTSSGVRRRINYFVDEWTRISAWVFIPEGRDPVPGILCCHQTVPQGKDEPAGLDGDPRLAFAQHYADLGYVTIAPDCITAGERRSAGLEAYDTRMFYKDHPRASAMGRMLWDHMRALDALCETRRVDPDRLGVIGHSLGGYNALFLAAFDERVKTCVASCAFTRFEDDENPERWARDEGFVHFPKLKEAIKERRFPFDWEHVLALATPTPILLFAALNDEIFSNTKSCAVAVKRAAHVYKLLNSPDALKLRTHREGHGMTWEHLDIADQWFERWL